MLSSDSTGTYFILRIHFMKILTRIIKTFALGALLFSVSPSLRAENVSQKQAKEIAKTFFNAAYGQYVADPKFVWNGRQLTTDRLFAPFYIYNHPKGGFVIISADSKAYPILGYSKTGKFDRERLTDDDRELLRTYARQIELIRYDSRVPERAIGAWRNIPLYINKVLTNPYNTPEYEALDDQSKENLEAVDRRNSSIMMPAAVEFHIYDPGSYREYTLDDVTAPEEEIPFSFYEDFIAQIAEEENARRAALDEIISPNRPVTEYSGGAHYTIRYPQHIRLVRIYGMDGMAKLEKYYKDTDVVNIDISALPVGFYAMLALSDDGHVYGMKIFR